MNFRITLGTDILEDAVEGLDAFATRIARDEDVRGIFVRYPNTLTFTGKGYEILRDLLDSGYCNEIGIKIETECIQGWELLAEGIIFARAITLNRSRCTAQAPIQEDSFSARIFNNKSIKVNIRAEESKNGETIAPTPLLGGMEMWSPTCTTSCVPTFDTGLGEAGFAHSGRRQHFDIMDVIKFLVRYMTDGADVTVVSDWYDTIGAINKTAIMLGSELRLGDDATGDFPEVSFDEVYEFLYKAHNLLMVIQGEPGQRVIRIEHESYFRSLPAVVTLDHVDDIEETVRQDLLYAKVKFGSSDVLDTDTPDFPILNLFGHQQEEFQIQGTCNTTAELDLELPFITDHNVILDSLLNDTESWDDSIIAVQYNSSVTPNRATVLDPLNNLTNIVYNQLYLNNEIIERYDLQGALAKYLPDGPANRFLAETVTPFNWTTPPGLTTIQVPYQDDYTSPNFDANNNYGNGTTQGSPVAQGDSRYTAPANGLYGMFTTVYYQRTGIYGPTQDKLFINMQRYNSSDVLIEERTVGGVPQWFGSINQGVKTTNHQEEIYWSTYMEAGDYIIIQAVVDSVISLPSVPPSIYSQWTIRAGSFFNCLNVFDGGGIYTEQDADLFYVLNYRFSRALEQDKIQDLLENPIGAIDFNTDGVTNIRAYIDDVNITHNDGETSWLLITNPANKIIVA